MGQGKQAEGGVLKKLRGEEFLVASSCVIFLGKGRKGMRNISRWWKGGEWVECLGHFKK
jgi:hypothetical protein